MIDFIFSNKIVYALLNLLVNFGSQFIIHDLEPIFTILSRQAWLRKFILFGVILLTTRDFVVSLLLTISLAVLVDILLNEKHSLCLIPRAYRSHKEHFDSPVHYQQYRRVISSLS